jgi:hypothetical protein
MAAKRPTPVADQPIKGQRTNPYKAAKRLKDPQKGQKNPRGVWMGSLGTTSSNTRNGDRRRPWAHDSEWRLSCAPKLTLFVFIFSL